MPDIQGNRVRIYATLPKPLYSRAKAHQEHLGTTFTTMMEMALMQFLPSESTTVVHREAEDEHI